VLKVCDGGSPLGRGGNAMMRANLRGGIPAQERAIRLPCTVSAAMDLRT